MRYLLILALSINLGCAGKPPPDVKAVPNFAADADKCPAAKVNLDRLSCPNGQGGHLGDPNKSGVPFVDICENLYTQGVNFQAPCFAAAQSCQEVFSCRP